jgi:hypothetical protein
VLNQPHMSLLVSVLRSSGFREVVNLLPGYDASNTGEILTLSEAFSQS